MNIVELIRKKRDGEIHTVQEVDQIIQGISQGNIPDYQLSAWLMAVWFNGMDEQELTHLTQAMASSGDMLDLKEVPGIKVDKHSTGGVGDKVTLVLAPLMASAGVVMAKLSGRGLGHTGGTIDKLEAIPGFNTSLSGPTFIEQLKQVGVAVAGQTQNLAPADKVLYALRDVTATVDSIPLIVSSVLSKKIAAGADVIVLDVKYGSGAFMKNYESAQKLAHLLVRVGNNLGRSVSVALSDMDQPLGCAIGHSLEVEEAIETLKGRGPDDLRALCLKLGAVLLQGAEKAESLEAGENILAHKIENGDALTKLREMIVAQGGDPGVIEDYQKMPHTDRRIAIQAPHSGYVHHIEALGIGKGTKLLGAGREKKSDTIDLAVGVRLIKRRGDWVEQGDILAQMYVNRVEHLEQAKKVILNSYVLQTDPPGKAPPLIGEIIYG